jgi:ATP-dependent Clp protease ATP-binding subunit ClpC
VQAVFEKFSERSIKSVMFAQQEAKNLGASEVHTWFDTACVNVLAGLLGADEACPQVTTEHVLLGIITEDTSSKNGYLNSGLTAEKARAAVQSLSGKRKPISTTDSIPFSREVRKTFEAATNVSAGWLGLKAAAWICF